MYNLAFRKGLAQGMPKQLKRLSINEGLNERTAETYDGAAVMSDNFRVQYSDAKFIHYYAHQLNLLYKKLLAMKKV